MKTGLASSLLALLLAQALPAQAGEARMIYWTASDCGPCKLWSHTERRAEFEAEAARLGVTLVVVNKPSVRDPVARYVWPAAESGLATQMQAFPAPLATPSFDFVCKGRLERRLQGVDDWDSFWKKTLRQLARDCAS